MSDLAKFTLAPRTLDEAFRVAEIVSKSDFCPKEFRGKPADVLCAMQFAAEIGMNPVQGIQNIAVINGKPSLYGDAALAVCRAHPSFVSIVERDPSEAAQKGGHCTLTVRNGDGSTTTIVRTFTIEDAKRANLIGKVGPWTQYPGRMFQMRARAFALRDGLPEALKGLSIREEAEDLPPVIPQTTAAVVVETQAAPALTDAETTPIDDFDARLNGCGSLEQLAAIAADIGEVGLSKEPRLVAAYKAAKARIQEAANG